MQRQLKWLISPFYSNLRKYLTEDVVRDVMGDHNAIEELEAEWEKLKEDRHALRHTFPNGNSRVRRSGIF